MMSELGGVGGVGQEPIAADSRQTDSGRREAYDWTNDPEFRRFQSEQDAKYEQMRLRAEQAERRNEELATELAKQGALLEALKSGFERVDPDTAHEFERYAADTAEQIESQRLREKLAVYEAREQFRSYHIRMAQIAGIDVGDPRFQRALESGRHEEVERAKAEILRQKLEAPSPQTRLTADEIKQQIERGDHLSIPPGQVISPPERERRRAEYFKLKYQLPQGDLGALDRLRARYQDVLDPDEW